MRLVDDLRLKDRSYVTMPFSDFDLQRFDDDASSRYLEFRPRLVRFASRKHSDLGLDVTVDVFEVLMRMRDGYTPNREDLRGSWLSLGAFKQKMASMSSKDLRLQRASGGSVRISVDEDGRIVAGSL